MFPEVSLVEVVFLAISADFQIKGFGSLLMSELKAVLQEKKFRIMMTCADNLAIGYFKKQGFHKEILVDPVIYKGYLKDYEGSTLMEFIIEPNIDYRTL